MSYTKTTWVTGDTITAAKLNNAEGGIEGAQWKSESTTQLFSESVTTAENHGMGGGALAYNTPITADTLIVTFNGTEYVCNKVTISGPFGDNYAYGGFGENGPDFTEYPFCIMCSPIVDPPNVLYTETAGTYTIAASVSQTSYTEDFATAVQSFVPQNIQDGAGQYSIKEGNDTTASAYASHAQNIATIAQGYGQTAIGQYNVAQGTPDSTASTDYAFIIGNGTENSRSNALAVRWDGAIVLADGTVLTVAQLAKVANLT